MKPDYKIYATLLDAHCWYRKSESDNCEQELLDKINRVPVTDEKALERMNRGTALNNCIDSLLINGYDMLVFDGMRFEGFDFSNNVLVDLCNELHGSISQHFTSFQIVVNGKVVELYGYIDYIKENKAIDLKSTSSYELGKYKSSMQMHVYPLSLHHEGVHVDEFEFLVTDFKEVYSESYRVDLHESLSILKEQCAMVIDFLECKRHLITDQKVFGGEKEKFEETVFQTDLIHEL